MRPSDRPGSGASTPVHVFELGFEGLAKSPRHRSGIAFVLRMLRWRRDKRPDEADAIDNVRQILASVER